MKKSYGLALLGLVCLWPATAHGQWSILDEIELHDPALSVDVIWEIDACECSLSGTCLDSVRCDDFTYNGSERRWLGFDAEGNRYGINKVILATPNKDWHIRRELRESRTEELLVTMRENDSDVLNIHPRKGWDVDMVNGWLLMDLFVGCNESRCGESFAKHFRIRISGLPVLSDVIPEGPPGPPGSPGAPGPPGPPADESRVTTLETLVVAQQAEIEALTTALDQIENLPTIQRLLDKVQELEQAAP